MTDPSDPTAQPPEPREDPPDRPSLHKQPSADSERTDGEPPRSFGTPPPGQQYGPPPGQQYGPPPGQQYGPPPGQPGFPAMPPPSAAAPVGGYYRDEASGLHLPVGTELASVGRRIGAYFLAIPLVIVTLGIGYLIWGLILWPRGTTPALKVLGMKVFRIDNGTVPGFGRMALREILGRICDGILSLLTGLISFILFASSAKRQSLHDLVASTTVLYDPNKVLGN